MYDLEKLRLLLRNDYSYSFTCNVSDSRINMSYAWGKKGGVIDRIEVYVCGVNPISGKVLDRNDYRFTFGAANQKVSVKLPLYGEYTLQFDAVTKAGTRIDNFCTPYSFQLHNASCRPYIRYGLQKVKMGWTKLTVNSNCFPRLRGNLWLRCGRSLQRMPDMTSNTISCYIALNQENAVLEVTEITSLSPLPKPIRDDSICR